MIKFNWWMRTCTLSLLWTTAAIALPAQTTTITPSVTFTTLHSLDKGDGTYPFAGLIQGTDGRLYGTTYRGGDTRNGTIFNIAPNGRLKLLYTFCEPNCPDGAKPASGLIQDASGNYYGTTLFGGAHHRGTIFQITPGGKLTTLYSFCPHPRKTCPAGPPLPTGLVQGSDGGFYGTTFYGGANNYGSIFSINAGGNLKTIYSFDVEGGYYPHAGLVEGANGKFYGTTANGGANGDGTAFEITAGGTLTTLHSFDRTDGTYPEAGLVRGTDGMFYGTTYAGGANNNGTVFKITPSGALTTLHSFDGKDGFATFAALIQGTDGNFYGATFDGGSNGDGTIFRITPKGALTTLHNFDGTDGENPFAALVQDTNGTFYGTTYIGGDNNHGTVFRLSVGLGPFVETQPTSGKVGVAINILGTKLARAISVTFNGTAATFTVVSSTLITTTVPTGATTGKVQVVTPSGALSSNVPFRVTP
jgi:uncharacterized repeat protein (TIGR03803 family)